MASVDNLPITLIPVAVRFKLFWATDVRVVVRRLPAMPTPVLQDAKKLSEQLNVPIPASITMIAAC